MEQEKEPVSKLLVDNPLDFKLHAAYLAYSEAWNENPSEETRTELNGFMSSLCSNKVNYEEFYSNVSQFRKQQPHFSFRIKSQKKSSWRKNEQKNSRNSRYK